WLEARCASAKDCHGAKPAFTVDLDLRPGAAYEQLVNKSSEERFGWKRVAPGDPDRSYVVAKLTGALGAREGKPMPLDAQTGAPAAPATERAGAVRRLSHVIGCAGAIAGSASDRGGDGDGDEPRTA